MRSVRPYPFRTLRFIADRRLIPATWCLRARPRAFVIPDEDVQVWQRHLEKCGVAIEAEVAWPEGGRSLYVRDPAGNSVELAPPTIWKGLGIPLVEATRSVSAKK
jgi:hypothetical protein